MALITLTGYVSAQDPNRVLKPKAIRYTNGVYVFIDSKTFHLDGIAAEVTDPNVQTFCDDYASILGWVAE